MADENQEKIEQLQRYEQSRQNILVQKQQFQAQESELDTALKEVQQSTESYRIIGNVMVKTSKNELADYLNSKKTTIQLRLKALEKQEDQIKQKAQVLQQEVMKGMEK